MFFVVTQTFIRPHMTYNPLYLMADGRLSPNKNDARQFLTPNAAMLIARREFTVNPDYKYNIERI